MLGGKKQPLSVTKNYVTQLCPNGCKKSKRYWYLRKGSSQLRIQFSPELHERHGSERSSEEGVSRGGTHARARTLLLHLESLNVSAMCSPSSRAAGASSKKKKTPTNPGTVTTCPFAVPLRPTAHVSLGAATL